MEEGDGLLPHYILRFDPTYLLTDTVETLRAYYHVANSSAFRSLADWKVGEEWREPAGQRGERRCLVKSFDRRMHPSQARAWAREGGYRPATHMEAILFGCAYPEVVHSGQSVSGLSWIMALGSTTMHDGHPHAAVLQSLCRKVLSLDLQEATDRSFPLVEEGRYLLVKLAA
jgi:hypothetical protein